MFFQAVQCWERELGPEAQRRRTILEEELCEPAEV